ncbi:hypothetical protein ACHWQZ_G010689 [Mnemiopsis leidyi]
MNTSSTSSMSWNTTFFWTGTFPSSYSYQDLYTTRTRPPPDRVTEPVFGVITLLMVVFGAPANIVSFLYFMKKSGSNASTTVYRFMNIVDLYICFLLIPIGLNYFNQHRKETPYLFNVHILCNIWSISWNTAGRLSIYLIGVMSTARAISLCKPLYFLRRNAVVIPFTAYTVFLLVQQTLPYWFPNKAHPQPIVRYFNMMGICTWTFADIMPMFSVGHKICDFFFIQLEFLFPVIPIVLSSAISIAKLLAKKEPDAPRAENKNRKHATTTIIILSVVFVLLNTPFLVYQAIASVGTYTGGDAIRKWNQLIPLKARRVLDNIYNIHLIGLNSCINPIIYFIRIKELRAHVFSPRNWTKTRNSFKHSSTSLKSRYKNQANGSKLSRQHSMVVTGLDKSEEDTQEGDINGAAQYENGYKLLTNDQMHTASDTIC